LRRFAVCRDDGRGDGSDEDLGDRRPSHNAYANGSELKDSVGFGARGAYHYKARHGVELTLEFAQTDSTVSDSDVSYDVRKWTIDYLHELKQKKADTKLAPFLIFGFGKFNVDSCDASSAATVVEGGGGLRIFMTKRFALRFDGRIWHYHGIDPVPDGHWFAFDLGAGVSYFLGGAEIGRSRSHQPGNSKDERTATGTETVHDRRGAGSAADRRRSGGSPRHVRRIRAEIESRRERTVSGRQSGRGGAPRVRAASLRDRSRVTPPSTASGGVAAVNGPRPGLVDFQCLYDRGVNCLLCWKFGEAGITHWHRIADGFAGRRPLSTWETRTAPGPVHLTAPSDRAPRVTIPSTCSGRRRGRARDHRPGQGGRGVGRASRPVVFVEGGLPRGGCARAFVRFDAASRRRSWSRS
jgi:hypothetical protein